MKYLLILTLVIASYSASAQTSKDSLVLKMHRREWQASIDTLFYIMPAIGRAKSADDADKLQVWMNSVLSRMAMRLDTIPRRKP